MMTRLIRIAVFVLIFTTFCLVQIGRAQSANDVIVNEFDAYCCPRDQWIELLVVNPSTVDMRGWIITDMEYDELPGSSEGLITLSNDDFWSAIPFGTYILIYVHGQTGTNDFDVSDKTIVIYTGTANATYYSKTGNHILSSSTDNISIYSGDTYSSDGIDHIGWGNYQAAEVPNGLTWSTNISGSSTDRFYFSDGSNFDNDDSDDWTSFTDGNGTPGAVNTDQDDSSLLGVTISGSSDHFRMMSSPVAGQIYGDLLSELWTQGMTAGGDVTSGSNNVWTYSGSGWTDVTDISGSGTSLTAGQGFLVYVYVDTDNDGNTDDSGANGYLPVTLSVSGTENSGDVTVPSSGSIDADAWEFAGNPYATTIDWDDVTQTNVTTSAYVWDSQAGTPAYISWNGSSGSLSNGLIAPYQGFFVQGSAGGSGSITIAEADKSSSAGTFYKTMADNTGSMSFTIASGDYSDQTFVSFMNNGEEGIDGSDTYKLLPMTPSERVVGISYAEGNGLDINNLPYSQEGSIAIPLDVMYLTVDDDYNFVTNENEVTMSWDLSSLPETVTSLTLTDNTSGSSFNLDEQSEVTFTTVEKGSFPAYGSGGVNIYPEVGESQFTLSVAYSALTTNDDMMPKEFALHPAYPNPFNPSTTISFDIPDATDRNTSLHIYDITGKLVETLVNKVLPSGSHAVTWDPKNLSSGLYIVQLKAGNKTFSQKLTFLK